MKDKDRLYCHTTYHHQYFTDKDRKIWFTKGKIYILHFNNVRGFFIIDDENDINQVVTSSIPRFFYTEKQYRKLKLEKLFNI